MTNVARVRMTAKAVKGGRRLLPWRSPRYRLDLRRRRLEEFPRLEFDGSKSAAIAEVARRAVAAELGVRPHKVEVDTRSEALDDVATRQSIRESHGRHRRKPDIACRRTPRAVGAVDARRVRRLADPGLLGNRRPSPGRGFSIWDLKGTVESACSDL